jgi:probable rRNA maturation factor
MVESLPSCMTGRVQIDLALEDAAWLQDLPDVEAAVETAGVAVLDRVCAGPALNMSVVLTDDAEVQALNLRWRGIDMPTNVLSFPTEERSPDLAPAPPPGAPSGLPIELGDIVLARETVMREARAGGITPRQHLCHLVVHGSLHLLGYDHEEDVAAECMEGLEIAVLADLGIPNPYQ